MKSLNIQSNIIKILILATIISFSNCQTPIYNPVYINSMSDIPIICAPYASPQQVRRPPIANSTLWRFEEAIQMLSTITDPIFDQTIISGISLGVFDWATDLKDALYASILNYIPLFNIRFRIDAGEYTPAKYIALDPPFATIISTFSALKPQGDPYVSSLTTMINSFNGVTLTTGQQSQLAQLVSVKSKIQTLKAIFSSFVDYAGFIKSQNQFSAETAQAYVDEMLEQQDTVNAIVYDSVFCLGRLYDFYVSYNTLNENY